MTRTEKNGRKRLKNSYSGSEKQMKNRQRETDRQRTKENEREKERDRQTDTERMFLKNSYTIIKIVLV